MGSICSRASAFFEHLIARTSDQLLRQRREAGQTDGQTDEDGVEFRAAEKPDLLPGMVERLWALALGSGVPEPPPPIWALSRWRWAAHIGLEPERGGGAQVSAKG